MVSMIQGENMTLTLLMRSSARRLFSLFEMWLCYKNHSAKKEYYVTFEAIKVLKRNRNISNGLKTKKVQDRNGADYRNKKYTYALVF